MPNKNKYIPSAFATIGLILFVIGTYILISSTMTMSAAKYKAVVNPGTSAQDFSYTFTVERKTYTFSKIYPDLHRDIFYRLSKNPYDQFPAGSTIEVAIQSRSRRGSRFSTNHQRVFSAYILYGADYLSSGICIIIGLGILYWDNKRQPPSVETSYDSYP